MSSINKRFVLTMVAVCAVPLFATAAQPDPDKCIAVLKSNAPRKEKADACRELAIFGTKEAISPLVSFLADEELSDMARYGLETMPFPEVDAALREALPKLQGRPLVGVIHSIGKRRDGKAVSILEKYLADTNLEVNKAAARALGSIGTSDSAKILEKALPGATKENQLDISEGLLRCADRFASEGQRPEAVVIYQKLNQTAGLHQVRTAALKGLILTQPNEGIPLLKKAVNDPDYLLMSSVVRASIEMPGKEVTLVLANAVKGVDKDRQTVLLQALGQRADVSASPALKALLKENADKNIRLQVIRTMGQVGDASFVPDLQKTMDDPDAQLSQAAQETLSGLQGKETDAVIIKMVESGDTKHRLAGMDMVERRRMLSALPVLKTATSDSDPAIRAMAFRRLGELAGPDEIPSLVGSLFKATAQNDLDAIERALATMAGRPENSEKLAAQIASNIGKASTAQKIASLQVLKGTGTPMALATIRKAAADTEASVRTTAIRELSTWNGPEAMSELMTLAKDASNATDKTLSLRGLLGRIASEGDVPVEKRMQLCKDVESLAIQGGEKKLFLAALGSVALPESAALISKQLEDASVKEEAMAAFLNVADELSKSKQFDAAFAQLIPTLDKIAQSGNENLAKRAKALAGKAKK